MQKYTWRYYHFTYVYHKWQSYYVWFLRNGVQQTYFLSFSTIVCHFNPTNNQDNQNFEKMKKTPGDIITLKMCTINDNYMMYGSWDKEYKGQKFLSFWIIFWSFTPLTTQKIKIFKIWKNRLELSSFYKSIPKIMIICYTVIEIWHMTDVVFIFWTFTNPNNK